MVKLGYAIIIFLLLALASVAIPEMQPDEIKPTEPQNLIKVQTVNPQQTEDITELQGGLI